MAPRLREDLVASTVVEDAVTYVDVTDPLTGTAFRFYDFEYGLATQLDGRPLEEVVAWAVATYGLELTVPALDQFVRQLAELGYLAGEDGVAAGGPVVVAAGAQPAAVVPGSTLGSEPFNTTLTPSSGYANAVASGEIRSEAVAAPSGGIRSEAAAAPSGAVATTTPRPPSGDVAVAAAEPEGLIQGDAPTEYRLREGESGPLEGPPVSQVPFEPELEPELEIELPAEPERRRTATPAPPLFVPKTPPRPSPPARAVAPPPPTVVPNLEALAPLLPLVPEEEVPPPPAPPPPREPEPDPELVAAAAAADEERRRREEAEAPLAVIARAIVESQNESRQQLAPAGALEPGGVGGAAAADAAQSIEALEPEPEVELEPELEREPGPSMAPPPAFVPAPAMAPAPAIAPASVLAKMAAAPAEPATSQRATDPDGPAVAAAPVEARPAEPRGYDRDRVEPAAGARRPSGAWAAALSAEVDNPRPERRQPPPPEVVVMPPLAPAEPRRAAPVPHRRSGLWLFLVLAAAIGAGAVWYLRPDVPIPAPPAPLVHVVSPQPTTFYRWFEPVGVVVAGQNLSLGFAAAGRVQDVLAPGTTFSGGETVARLRGTAAREATVNSVRSRLAYYEQMLETARAQGKQGDVRLAEAKIAEKKQALAEGQAALAMLEIRPATAGKIAEVLAEVGAEVKAGTPVVRLQATGPRAEMPLGLEDRVKAQALAFCRLETIPGSGGGADGGTPEATARAIDCSLPPPAGAAVPVPGSAGAAAPAAGDDKTLAVDLAGAVAVAPGTQVRLASERYDGVFPVPRTAVARDGSGNYLWIHWPAGAATRRAVTATGTDGDLVLIARGLRVGDAVIVDPPPSLRDGSPIEIDR